jgi:hypothetical protein
LAGDHPPHGDLFSCICLPLSGLARGELLLRRTVYENKAFEIRGIKVETDGLLSPEQICAWAGVRAQANLMALDLARVKRDLELVPAIESAAVERILPGTLRIRVIEREPIARVIFARVQGRAVYTNSSLTLDANGYFMFAIEPGQRQQPAGSPDEHLPILAGIPTADMRPGRQVQSPQVRAALARIQAFQRSPMAGLADLKVIDVSQPGVLVAATGQENEITFGLNDFERSSAAGVGASITRAKSARHPRPRSRGGQQRPMLWEDAAGVTPATPKPVKPSPYRKKCLTHLPSSSAWKSAPRKCAPSSAK